MGIQDILNVIVSLLMDANPDSALNAEASDLIHEVRFLEKLAFSRPIDIVLSCAFTIYERTGTNMCALQSSGRLCMHPMFRHVMQQARRLRLQLPHLPPRLRQRRQRLHGSKAQRLFK